MALPDPYDPIGENSNRSQVLLLVSGALVLCVLCALGAGFYLLQTQPDMLAQVAASLMPPTPTDVPPPTRTRVLEPTSTLIPTATPQPTANYAATAEQAARDATRAAVQATAQAEEILGQVSAAQAAWPVVLTETFANNNLQWPVEALRDDYIVTQMTLNDGAYRWTTQAFQNFSYWNMLPKEGAEYADFYARAQVRFVRGKDDDSYAYGLVFRSAADEYGFFGIKPNGGARIMLVGGGGYHQYEIGATLYANDVNEIAVGAVGAGYVFFVNGEVVYILTDDLLTAGQIGLGVDATNPGGQSVVEFSGLVVQAEK